MMEWCSGKKAGVVTALVRTGCGVEALAQGGGPDLCFNDLQQFAEYLTGSCRPGIGKEEYK